MADADALRSLYGIDWTSVDERSRGLASAKEVMADGVQAQISPELGDRTLLGVEGFAVFVEGLEEDFSLFRYEIESLEQRDDGRYVLSGVIRARGRRSNMPLSSPFTHVWTVEDGRAVRVEASLSDAT